MAKQGKMKVREVNRSGGEVFDLIVRNRGRLILKHAAGEAVVLGCGSSLETALNDINNCYVSRTNGLRYEEV